MFGAYRPEPLLDLIKHSSKPIMSYINVPDAFIWWGFRLVWGNIPNSRSKCRRRADERHLVIQDASLQPRTHLFCLRRGVFVRILCRVISSHNVSLWSKLYKGKMKSPRHIVSHPHHYHQFHTQLSFPRPISIILNLFNPLISKLHHLELVQSTRF